jgi:FkbM family methyltransferase
VTLERALALLVGDRRRTRDVAFREADVEMRCRMHEDNLWGAVKDNLVLAEYERFGIRLRDYRGVVVDAGAHVGVFSLLASVHASRVLALEAHPGNAAMLKDNVARNGRKNVVAEHAALGSFDGTASFAEGPISSAGSLDADGGGGFEVPSRTLDAVIASTGPVDLLKLDVEGAEFDVLDAASDDTLSEIGAIVGELHLDSRADRLGPLVSRLGGLGFAVTVQPPPVDDWAASMRALWRHRHRLRGETRLRLVVVAVYTAVAVTDPVLHLRSRLGGGLAFLYATRPGR